MNLASEINLDKFRNKFESEEHWNLRKEFMQAHRNKFSEDRLLCLAQIFLNIEVLKCTYSENVMKQISELSIGLGHNYKADDSARLKRTLLNATDVARGRFKDLPKNKVNDETSVTIKTEIESSKLELLNFLKSKNSDENPNSGGNSVLVSDKELYPIENFTNLKLESREPCVGSTHLKPCKDNAVQFFNQFLHQSNSSFESADLSLHIKPELVSRHSSAMLRTAVTPCEYSTALRMESSENSFEDPHSDLERKLNSDFTFTLEPEELSNRELHYILNNWNCHNILNSALNYSKLKLQSQFNQELNTRQWSCRLTVHIRGDTWMLGSFIDRDCRMAAHFAARDAMRMVINRYVPIKVNNANYLSHANFPSIIGPSNCLNTTGITETAPSFMHTLRNKMLTLIQEVLKTNQDFKHFVQSPLSPEEQEGNIF